MVDHIREVDSGTVVWQAAVKEKGYRHRNPRCHGDGDGSMEWTASSGWVLVSFASSYGIW